MIAPAQDVSGEDPGTSSLSEHIGPRQAGCQRLRVTSVKLKSGGGPSTDANPDPYYQPASSGFTPCVEDAPIITQVWIAAQIYPSGSRGQYPPSALLDQDPTTSWQPETGGARDSVTLDAGDGSLCKPASFWIRNCLRMTSS